MFCEAKGRKKDLALKKKILLEIMLEKDQAKSLKELKNVEIAIEE